MNAALWGQLAADQQFSRFLIVSSVFVGLRLFSNFSSVMTLAMALVAGHFPSFLREDPRSALEMILQEAFPADQ
jgi:hypothetical protein